MFTATELREALQQLIEMAAQEPTEFDFVGVTDVRSYEEAMVMTRDEGLVVKLDDGSEFQITITQSR